MKQFIRGQKIEIEQLTEPLRAYGARPPEIKTPWVQSDEIVELWP